MALGIGLRVGETYGRGRSGEEDQRAEVGSALVAQSASGIDESTDAIGLQRGPDERCAPGDGRSRGLL